MALPDEPRWEPTVAVTLDRDLSAEMAGRIAAVPEERAIWVTDLLDPRRAFWRRTRGAPALSEERRAAIDAGRALHMALGRALSREGQLEVRVRGQGLVGRIDLLADVPTEVKTGGTVVDPDELRTLRPEHVEQLAMYCVLADRPSGRLLHLRTEGSDVREVRATDVRFERPAEVAGEMRRRVDALRTSLASRDPAGLPRCRWFAKGCEYRAANVCDCSGGEADAGSAMLDAAAGFTSRPELAERVDTGVRAHARPAEADRIARFRDVLYPRRTYFERTAPPGPEEVDGAVPATAGPADPYERAVAALESGPLGEVCGAPTWAEEPLEEVGLFRGAPYLVRTSRSWDPIRPEELAARSPQYVLELGFRCAATGLASGRVLVVYERAERAEDRVAVFDLRFGAPTYFSRIWRGRAEAIRDAVRRHAPQGLPACPAWRWEECTYRPECGCDPAVDRSHR